GPEAHRGVVAHRLSLAPTRGVNGARPSRQVTTEASSCCAHILAARSSAILGALSVWDLWETALMRRIASLVVLLWMLALVGCQPTTPPPTPASATSTTAQPADPTRAPAAGADAKPTASTWGDTNLPASSAPGMSSDDNAAERASVQ